MSYSDQPQRLFLEKMSQDQGFSKITQSWLHDSIKHRYSYNFTWLGRPIIQYPQDLVALQEIIWQTKPDLIIETGIAHGGSLIFYASLLELIGEEGTVLGIDIDIRQQNRVQIEQHPMFKRIQMLEGSSLSEPIVKQVYELAQSKKSIMVILDSMHTHQHVLQELMLYSPLVTKENYLVVLDTVIEKLPDIDWADCSWGMGNNPYTAVREFLISNNRFIDSEIDKRLMITVAPGGYLKCISD